MTDPPGPGPLNLAQLHAFTVIAQRGSAGRAAARLLRAQSAVTRSLRELEAALGEPLAGADWILPRRHTPARRLLDALFRHAGLPPPAPAVETGDLATVRGLLLGTDMVAVLSSQQVRYELRAGQLAVLDVPLPGTELRYASRRRG